MSRPMSSAMSKAEVVSLELYYNLKLGNRHRHRKEVEKPTLRDISTSVGGAIGSRADDA